MRTRIHLLIAFGFVAAFLVTEATDLAARGAGGGSGGSGGRSSGSGSRSSSSGRSSSSTGRSSSSSTGRSNSNSTGRSNSNSFGRSNSGNFGQTNTTRSTGSANHNFNSTNSLRSNSPGNNFRPTGSSSNLRSQSAQSGRNFFKEKPNKTPQTHLTPSGGGNNRSIGNSNNGSRTSNGNRLNNNVANNNTKNNNTKKNNSKTMKGSGPRNNNPGFRDEDQPFSNRSGNGPGGNGPRNGPTNVAGGGGRNNNAFGFDPSGFGGDGGNFDGVGGGGGGGGGPAGFDEDRPFAQGPPGDPSGFASNNNNPLSGSGSANNDPGSRSLDPGTAANSRNNAPQGNGTTDDGGGAIRTAGNFDLGAGTDGSGDADSGDAPIVPLSQRIFDRRFLVLQNHTGQPIKIYLRYRTLTNRGQWDWVPGEQGDLIYALNPGEERYIGNKNVRILADRALIWARGDNGELYETYRFNELVLGRPNERDPNGELAYRGSRFGTFTYRFK